MTRHAEELSTKDQELTDLQSLLQQKDAQLATKKLEEGGPTTGWIVDSKSVDEQLKAAESKFEKDLRDTQAQLATASEQLKDAQSKLQSQGDSGLSRKSTFAQILEVTQENEAIAATTTDPLNAAFEAQHQDDAAGGESAGAMLTVMHKGIRYQLPLPVGGSDGEAFFVELGPHHLQPPAAADGSPAEIGTM